MAKTLTSTIQNQIDNQDIKITFTFKIDSTDFSSYLLDWNDSTDKNFGAASATFTLNNDDGRFSNSGINQIDVGDTVELIENYGGDTTNWKRFYGLVTQRSIGKTATTRTISISCLDYISVLQSLDIDLVIEGTKVKVENETLTPNYLASPNDSLAQLYDFANDSLCDNPLPIVVIYDRVNSLDDPQYDGLEILYEQGQLKLGSPLNTKYNYHVIAREYHYYTKGKYIEDIFEEIITEVDGYGKYLFGESSASDVITNHLTTTFNEEEGTNQDIMTPNYTSSTITIETTLSANISAGVTSIILTDASGFSTSGTGSINGDTFTWTGKSSNTLTGIPTSGSNSLKAHSSGDYVEYEATYSPGRVWYLTYSNVQTDLSDSDFTIPSPGRFFYFDKRYGRIILTTNIGTSSTVISNTNYTFKTLQATGIELNKISFRSREVANRFEAINKLRNYLAPNFIVRTQGDNKIWASYLSQKVNEDYDLALMTNVNYLEDEDLYTRILFYGKNKTPTNIMFGQDIAFITPDVSYKGTANQTELSYDRDSGNYYVYKTTISGAGYIDLDTIKPIVYINGVAIDNNMKRMSALPVQIEVKSRTFTRTGCHGYSSETYTKIHSYYYYKVIFPHTSIEASQPIRLYNSQGTLTNTISAYDYNMDYGRGIWYVPGIEQNSKIESLSTSTYFVMYSTGKLVIDYDVVEFLIDKSLVPSRGKEIVTATFEYWTVMIPVTDIASIIDGRWDSQIQTEFFTQPPSGYNFAILDLGQIYTIQAMDLVAGFFRPDEIRKYDINMSLTLQYSTDNINYYAISSETKDFQLNGGESISFEESDLGINFQARYLKLILEDIKKIDFRDGVWVVALSEFSAYNDIYLKSESKLIATTKLTKGVNAGEEAVEVVSTADFTDPDSGEEKTAYIGTNAFTYTDLTSTQFRGCTIDSGITGEIDDRVSQTMEDDTSIYDDDGLLQKLGDRVYKDIRIDDEFLYTQSQLDLISKAFLEEYYKNHTKISVDVLYAPYLQIGHTVKVTDVYNDIDRNYFIEGINDRNGYYNLTLAYYPD